MTALPSEAASIYLDLMNEIKGRLQLVNRCQDRHVAAPMFHEEYLMIETVMLQLRMICELIAFACLAAHDKSPRKDIRKAYSATKMFHDLSRLKPEFFPEPVEGRIDPTTGLLNYERRSDALDRSELEALYEYCNENLLRARYAEILARERRIYRSDYLIKSANKIAVLLDVHLIKVALPEQMIRITMHGPKGGVHWDTLNSLPVC